MQVEYLAHACFLLTLQDGTRLLVDPYEPVTGYRSVDLPADYTLISHDHFDHNYLAGVRGRTVAVRGCAPRQCGGARVSGVLGDHDHHDGAELGKTVCFIIEADGLRVLHLGDLCCPFDDPTVQNLGEIDLLLFPCGGGGTCLDAAAAWKLLNRLRPRVAVPMHYRTPFTNRELFPEMDTLGPFSEMGKVEKTREHSLMLEPGEFGSTRVLALSHRLEGRPSYAR